MLTTVTATVVDPAGQPYAGGTYRCTFWMPSGYTPSQANWPGGDIPMVVSGTLDANGSFSVDLPDNLTITPVGSAWTVTVTPLATSPSTEINCVVTGDTQDISAEINAELPYIQVPVDPAPIGRPLARAYSDDEIFEPVPGTIYFNLTDKCVHFYDGAVWKDVCGGGSGVNIGSIFIASGQIITVCPEGSGSISDAPLGTCMSVDTLFVGSGQITAQCPDTPAAQPEPSSCCG